VLQLLFLAIFHKVLEGCLIKTAGIKLLPVA